MFELRSPFEFFCITVDHVDLHKKFIPVESMVDLTYEKKTLKVYYVAWVNLLWPESRCVVCGRPASHVCVIHVNAIIEDPSSVQLALDLRTRESRSIKEEVEELLLHYQPICLALDCVRPPRRRT
jgi:hypothetical protein